MERPSGGVQGMEADEGAVSEVEQEGQGGVEFVPVAELLQAWWKGLDPGPHLLSHAYKLFSSLSFWFPFGNHPFVCFHCLHTSRRAFHFSSRLVIS